MKKPPGYDKKPKQKYAVYCRAKYYEWQHIGDTWAVSEQQAINNVRWRLTEDEYDRIDDRNPLDFKAEIIKKETEENV